MTAVTGRWILGAASAMGLALLFLAPVRPVRAGEKPAAAVPGSPVPSGPTTAVAPPAKRTVRTFTVYGDNWEFAPNVIQVKKGDHVVLHLHAYRATRSFVLKAYKIDALMPQDQDVKVEFDADVAGTFPYKCGRPCGDGCAKLRGKLVVEE